MNSDLENLQAEIAELEAVRDRVISLSDSEKSKYQEMIQQARAEGKNLRKELEVRDRVGRVDPGTARKPPEAQAVQEGLR